MGPRPFGRGRGRADRGGVFAERASMGPRPFGRGRAVRSDSLIQDADCFNGAATFRSRKVPKLPFVR